MNNFIRNKNIHIIGISGNEGSAILDYINGQNPSSVTGHDFISENEMERNFKLWHKNITESEKEELWQKFNRSISTIKLNIDKNYLKSIDKADIIFVPQSWRLYSQNNKLLSLFNQKPGSFYNLTRLYLEKSKAFKIAVTGTVGKGSTSYLIYQILKKNLPGKNIYFAGNETWNIQIGDKIDSLSKEDILVLEVSHRQLQDGLENGPDIAVFTNLYPNHMDELSFNEYNEIKLKLLTLQSNKNISILNYDDSYLWQLKGKLKSKIIFFSLKDISQNDPQIQYHFDQLIKSNPAHYPANILAASAASLRLNISIESILQTLPSTRTLPARIELIENINSIKIYDDIKSTTPWAGLAALVKLGQNTILICGGSTKNIDYKEFVNTAKMNAKYIICLESQLSKIIKKDLNPDILKITGSLDEALKIALKLAAPNDNILISPSAGFFYSQFIKGKKSIRRLLRARPSII